MAGRQRLYSQGSITHLSQLSPADHIRVDRGVYHHHMMVVGVVSDTHLLVIHYTGVEVLEEGVDGSSTSTAVSSTSTAVSSSFSSFSFSGGGTSGEIKEETLEIDPSEVHLLTYKETPESIYCAEDAIDRGRSRLGEKRYSVVLNNCEHFVNWAKTGSAASGQTQAGGAALVKGIQEGMRAGKENGSIGWGMLMGVATAVSSYLQEKNDSQTS